MLVVEVARGGRNLYGHKMHGWKVMTSGIPVARMNKAKGWRGFSIVRTAVLCNSLDSSRLPQ